MRQADVLETFDENSNYCRLFIKVWQLLWRKTITRKKTPKLSKGIHFRHHKSEIVLSVRFSWYHDKRHSQTPKHAMHYFRGVSVPAQKKLKAKIGKLYWFSFVRNDEYNKYSQNQESAGGYHTCFHLSADKTVGTCHDCFYGRQTYKARKERNTSRFAIAFI